MKRFFVVMLVIFVSVSFLAIGIGCAKKQEAEEPVPEEEVEEVTVDEDYELDEKTAVEVETGLKGDYKGVLAISWGTTGGIPVVDFQQKTSVRTAEKLGYKGVIYDSHWDTAEQINQIQTMIQQGISGVVLAPNDGVGILPGARMLKEAGIPVVCEDSGLSLVEEAKGLCQSYVTSDNFRAGEYCGEYIAWQLNGKGKVAVIGFRKAPAGYERENGVMNVLRHYPDIEIVAYAEGGSVEAGMKAAEDFIQRAPDLAAVYAINDPSGVGVYNVLKAVGKTDQVIIAGNDGDPLAQELIKTSNGTFGYSSAQYPQIMGRIAVENLIAIIEDRPKDIQENVEIIATDLMWPTLYIPPFPMTIETVDDYPDWSKDLSMEDIDPTPIWWKSL
jgi:ribose transport system substrate-binding protein